MSVCALVVQVTSALCHSTLQNSDRSAGSRRSRISWLSGSGIVTSQHGTYGSSRRIHMEVNSAVIDVYYTS